LRHGRLCT